LIARAPQGLPPLIEARGVGLIKTRPLAQTRVDLVVEMTTPEPERLPPLHHIDLCGVTLPCLYRVDAPHFPASLLLLCRSGRLNPDD